MLVSAEFTSRVGRGIGVPFECLVAGVLDGDMKSVAFVMYSLLRWLMALCRFGVDHIHLICAL